jgi:dipeptidyl aminopeptidase/acylaminoacyl peptidase
MRLCKTVTGVDLDRFHAFQRFPQLVQGGQWTPMWRPDGRSFCVVDGAPDRTAILQVDPETGATAPLLDAPRVRKALETVLASPVPWTGLPFTQFRFVNAQQAIEFCYDGRWFRLDVTTYELIELPPAEQERRARQVPREIGKTFLGPRQPIHEAAAPDGTKLLTTREGNLWLRLVADDRCEQLTDDASEDVTWTVEDARWDADSRYVAAIRTDATGVDRLPVVHWLKPLEEVEWAPYAKSGARQAVRELCVVDTLSKRVVAVDLGRPGDDTFRLTPLAFIPDGRFLFLVSDRRNKVLELRSADIRTGDSTVTVEERQESFVYGINWIGFATSFTLLPDSDHFVWMSERDGWRHAYFYRLDGELVRRLTDGTFEVERVVGVDLAAERIYLVARSDAQRPYDSHLCSVSIDGTGFRQLTNEPGVHLPIVSPDGDTVVDIHSSVDRAPRTDLHRGDGTLVTTLAVADVSTLDELAYQPPEEFTATALDGETVLYGVLYKPPGFNPTRRYPVVEYIYGGPQLITHQLDYLNGGLARMLAQLGFVTFVVDGPGTPGRGKKFQDVVAKRFGQYEVEEHANVVRQLAQQHVWFDVDRVGIIGGSWGGYNTIRALLRAPDTYNVGVAFYPVADCINGAGTAIEPYLDYPQDEPAAYAAASNLSEVDKLRGKLFLIHGTSDVNAPFSATMQLVDAFIKADKAIDLLVVPELDHSTDGWRAHYAFDRAAEYLVEHLGGAVSRPS